jgi:hypothetical protein
MSSCDAWIQFVTPSDVRALKTRLDPFVVALDSAVVQCPKMDPATRDAWTAFRQSWRDYVAAEDHFLSAGAEFNAGCEYQTTIAGWQRTIGSLACGVPGPSLPEPRPSGGDSATTSTVRTVAIAAGVIAVALTLRSFAR